MTLKEVLVIRDSLQKLANCSHLPLKVMYGAGKCVKQIQDALDLLNKKNKALFDELGVVKMIADPNDAEKKIPDPSGTKEILPENLEAYQKRYDDTINEEIGDLYEFKINLNDLVSEHNFLKDLYEKYNASSDKLIEAMHEFEKNPKDDILRAKFETMRKDLTKSISKLKEKVEAIKNNPQFTVMDLGNLQYWIVDDEKS
jgi:hypothetical protein